MTKPNLDRDGEEEIKWINDALLSCHAKGTLPSRTFLEKCVDVARQAANRREVLTKLQCALPRVQSTTAGAKERVLDVARDAGLSVLETEQALFLPEGFLSESSALRICESSSTAIGPAAIAARQIAVPGQKVVKSSSNADAFLSEPALQRIRAWLLQLMDCADDPQTRACFENSAQKFAML